MFDGRDSERGGGVIADTYLRLGQVGGGGGGSEDWTGNLVSSTIESINPRFFSFTVYRIEAVSFESISKSCQSFFIHHAFSGW